MPETKGPFDESTVNLGKYGCAIPIVGTVLLVANLSELFMHEVFGKNNDTRGAYVGMIAAAGAIAVSIYHLWDEEMND